MIWIVLGVYLAGLVPAYCVVKATTKEGIWTKHHRNFALIFATSSWVTVMIGVIIWFVFLLNEKDDNKEVSW